MHSSPISRRRAVAPDEPAASRLATEAIPGIAKDAQGPVFHAPWEAQAFAITVSLQAAGLFAWNEWAAILGAQIRNAQAAGDPDTGETYYRHWLAALERIVIDKGIATREILADHCRAWKHAADRTPHGAPIELTPQDFRAASGSPSGESR